MAIYHLTPPIRGGERPRLPSTQIGPVTQAIRAMRSTDPAKTGTVSVISAGPASPGLSINSETDSHLLASDAAIAAIREGVMRFLAERIERDLALLDALDGDCDLKEDDPAGGDVCDEPHDPEEDTGAEENHSAAFLCEFNGYSYAPVIDRRRA